TSGDQFATWLGVLSDDFLAEQVSFPAGAQPPSKTRFEMLLSAKEHEMHHRAQLMVLQRMLGMVPHLTREQEARRAAMQAAKN
ncbi:MAG: DinB family protein, partial [Bryobacteraceae bacterium]